MPPSQTQATLMLSFLASSAASLLATFSPILAQEFSYSGSYSSDFSQLPGWVIPVAIAVALFYVACMWKIFTKAGQPGWAAIVPIYNMIVMLQIAGRPLWWVILLLLPFVNFIILILVMIDVAKAFGKGTGFGIGLALLGFLFFPILAFGGARYQGAPAR